MVEAHRGQDRDGPSPLPYASHPADVVCKLRYIGGVADEDLLAAALLHDVLEETEISSSALRKAFGDRVADLVQELTREEPTAEVAQALSQEELVELRSKLLLEGIAKMSPDAQAIKLADRLSNLEGARITRGPKKLARYEKQSQKILKIIPRKVNPSLWDLIERLLIER